MQTGRHPLLSKGAIPRLTLCGLFLGCYSACRMHVCSKMLEALYTVPAVSHLSDLVGQSVAVLCREGNKLCMQVEVSCTARVPSSSGRPGQGETYYSSPPGQPLHWVVGSSKVRPSSLTSQVTGV